jgi:hypothetical protein
MQHITRRSLIEVALFWLGFVVLAAGLDVVTGYPIDWVSHMLFGLLLGLVVAYGDTILKARRRIRSGGGKVDAPPSGSSGPPLGESGGSPRGGPGGSPPGGAGSART